MEFYRDPNILFFIFWLFFLSFNIWNVILHHDAHDVMQSAFAPFAEQYKHSVFLRFFFPWDVYLYHAENRMIRGLITTVVIRPITFLFPINQRWMLPVAAPKGERGKGGHFSPWKFSRPSSLNLSDTKSSP